MGHQYLLFGCDILQTKAIYEGVGFVHDIGGQQRGNWVISLMVNASGVVEHAQVK